MKNFTVKDFVTYNNPCKLCGRKISLSLIPVAHNESGYAGGIYPLFKKNLLHFNLWIKYKEKLAISVNPVNNSFSLEGESENLKKLMLEYKSENNLMFDITCGYCKTQILSEYIELKDNFIKPFKLNQESLIVKSDNYNYRINSDYVLDRSFIIAEKVKFPYAPVFTMETPLLSLSKIKTRENMIKKIKLYMLLS